jgi:nucleoside-diphosphate-sugar epimerase
VDETSLTIDPRSAVLVTGSNGFIGVPLVENLLERGFQNVRCLVRSTSHRTDRLFQTIERFPPGRAEVVEGNLKSRGDARRAVRDVRLVFHLAAGAEKSFPGTSLNTVVTTRTLLDALAVYSNRGLRRHAVLDENCPLETEPVLRDDPYVYAKLKQDEIVAEYAQKHGFSLVVLRPGAVYGPGKSELTARVGVGTLGVFLRIAGGNRIPFTHVLKSADAIALAGITPSVDGEIFNVIDDELPTGRQFMAGYLQHVGRRRYVPVSYPVFYAFSTLWEKYSRWSEGQLPPVFNRHKCSAYWKGNTYSNQKLKDRLGWKPVVSYAEGVRGYYEYLRTERAGAC